MTPRHSGGPSAQPLARRLAFRPKVLSLEDRSLPSVTNPLEPETTGDTPPVTEETPPPAPAVVAPLLAVGVESGSLPLVKVFDTATGQMKFQIVAFDATYRGGVRVATGDVSGDGIPDIIAAAGSGNLPLVKVFDGENGMELKRFLAYHPKFSGGVYVAAGDVNGDGHADIITGAGETGGPHVKVFNGAWAVPPIVIQNEPTPEDPASTTVPAPIDSTTELLTEFMAYHEAFRGGSRVAAGDVNRDGLVDIVTAAGVGGGPHIRVFDGVTFLGGAEWMAYGSTFTGGVYVTAGDLDGDGKAEVVTGAGTRGGTQVRTFKGETGETIRGFTAAQSATTASVRVAVVDFNQDGRNDLLTSFDSRIQVRDGQTTAVRSTVNPFDVGYKSGGVFLG